MTVPAPHFLLFSEAADASENSPAAGRWRFVLEALDGSTALEAAGTIHTEIMESFVKAEAIGWQQLVECGGYAAARDKGLLRIEGRDYLVQDGDVITIKV